MSKFKPGDRVKYIGKYPNDFGGEWEFVQYHPNQPKIVTVKPIKLTGSAMYSQAATADFYEDSIELIVKFKAGDRVKYVGKSSMAYAGEWEVVGRSVAYPNCWDCKQIKVTGNFATTNPGQMAQLVEANIELVSAASATPNTCTCPTMDLMSRGCKCGQIQRERNARGS